MILRCSIRNDFTDDLLSIHISDATSMLDSGVGRTKRSEAANPKPEFQKTTVEKMRIGWKERI